MFAYNILTDLGATVYPPHIVSDSKSAIDIIHNPGVTKRSVSFERWLFIPRDAHLANRAKFFLTTTGKMMADNMTKIVDKNKFFACRNFQMNI